VNIPDTVGFSTPDEYGALIGSIVKALGDCAWSASTAMTILGLAVANSIAAVQAGARQIECTINGIGERAGNCSLEEVVMAMKVRNDRFPFQDRHPHRASLTQQASCLVRSSRSGRSRIRRSWAATRSRMRPVSTRTDISREVDLRDYRFPSRWECRKASWCWASTAAATRLKQRCEQMGYSLSKDELDVVYREFTALADRKKGLLDEEIAGIVEASQKALAATVK